MLVNCCSYILKVPFESEDDTESGIVYVWIGSKAAADDVRLIEEIADEMFNNVSLKCSLFRTEINFLR